MAQTLRTQSVITDYLNHLDKTAHLIAARSVRAQEPQEAITELQEGPPQGHVRQVTQLSQERERALRR